MVFLNGWKIVTLNFISCRAETANFINTVILRAAEVSQKCFIVKSNQNNEEF